MSTETRKISQADWDRHRGTISDLYHSQKLPLSDHKNDKRRCVINVMKKEHGFHATLSQYEAQIRRWDSNKNLKRPEWVYLLAQYDRLVAEGRQPRIVSSGVLLSEPRINRARRHLQSTGHMQQPSSAPRQAFVEYQDHGGNRIRCSAGGQESRHDEEAMPRQLQSGHQGSMAVALRRSPSHSRALPVPANEHSLTVLESAQRDAAPTDVTGDIILIGRHDSAGLWQRCPNTASRFNPWGSRRAFRTANTRLPFMGTHLGLPDTGTRSMPQSLQLDLGDAITMHPLAQAIVARTSSLIPYNALSSSVVSGDTKLGIDISMLVRALVYSFSDRLENFQGTNRESVFGLLRHSKILLNGLQDFLPSVQPSTARCFADNLFQHAVEICDVQATAMVLDMAQRVLGYSIDPNTTRCVLNGKTGHYTPLEVASAQQDIELVRLLLGIGADPNHSYWTNREHIQGALECAMWDITMPYQRTMDSDSSNKLPPASMELVRLLLDNHVRVRPETLSLVARYPFTGKELLDEMIGRIETVDHDSYFASSAPGNTPFAYGDEYILFNGKYLMRDIVDIFHNSTAASAIEGFFSICSAEICGPCARRHESNVSAMLPPAARRANIGLMEFILTIFTPKSLQRALVEAIRGGNPQVIDILFEEGATVDEPVEPYYDRILNDDKGRAFLHEPNPLAEALLLQDGPLIKRLENLGALSSVIVEKESYFTAATIAAAHTGNITYLQKLWEKGSELNCSFPTNALSAAIVSDQYDTVCFLLFHTQIKVGPQNLEIAIHCQNKAVFDLLVEYITDWPTNTSCLMPLAVLWGNIEVLRCLIQHGVNVNRNLGNAPIQETLPGILCRFSYLTFAALVGDKVVSRWLLEHGAETNAASASYVSPLAVAALHDDVEMAHVLLARNSLVRDSLAFVFAMLYSRGIFETLLSAFRSQFPEGFPGFGNIVLTRAIHDGKVNQVQQLINSRMDVNTIVCESYTAHLRPIKDPEIGLSNVVNQRLERERDILSQFDRMSALGYAIYVNGCGNDYDMVRILLEAGGDPNSNARTGIADSKVWYNDPDTSRKDTAMATPLMLAIEHKDIGMMELLVERGADVNKPASQGLRYTPLQLACKLGSLAKVEFLLQRGADVRAGPSLVYGGTALQMAAQAGNIKIAQLLLDNGATVHEAPSRAQGRTAFEGAAEMGRITMLQFLWERACPRGFEQAEVERARKFADKEGRGGCVQYIDLLLMIVGGATPRLSPKPMQ